MAGEAIRLVVLTLNRQLELLSSFQCPFASGAYCAALYLRPSFVLPSFCTLLAPFPQSFRRLARSNALGIPRNIGTFRQGE
jgi:hypothetical protein